MSFGAKTLLSLYMIANWQPSSLTHIYNIYTVMLQYKVISLGHFPSYTYVGNKLI